MSIIYLQQNVLEAALERIRRLYREFPEVIVNFSGGKDSTVILNLTLQVAEECGRLPVHVLFIDQEAEWDMVITYIRQVMHDPRVFPLWFQGPFKIFNASASGDEWLHCWEAGKLWLREKEPHSIHDNPTRTDRFTALFEHLSHAWFGMTPRCHLAGVRCQESPGRMHGLGNCATYKDITWGTAAGKAWNQYTFYPLYDWRWQDVWKAIHDHGWPYCGLYDAMYQYGIPIPNMRVSNVHHETALKSLTFMQELEPVMWDKVTARVHGVNAVNQSALLYAVPKVLPWMFASWKEYRDHLLTNLITDPAIRTIFHRKFTAWEALYIEEGLPPLYQCEIASLLVNDYHGTKYHTWEAAHGKLRKSWQCRQGAMQHD